MARPLSGYPTSIGNKVMSVFPVAGPAVYAQYAAPSVGGQDVQTSAFGVKSIDKVIGGVTTDGLYQVLPAYVEASNLAGRSLGLTQVVLKWYVLATGLEVGAGVDLHGSTINLLVIGDQ